MKLLDAAGPAEVFAEANRFGARTGWSWRRSTATDVVTRSVPGSPLRPRSVRSIGRHRSGFGRRRPGRSPDRSAARGRGRPACSRGSAGWRPSAPGRSSWPRPECSTAAARPRTGGTPRCCRLLFREISVEPDAIFVRDGDVYTSAGVSAGIDLALALVEDDHGADLVRDVARSLVVYLKRAGGQSQFSALVEARPPHRSNCVRSPRPSPPTPARTTP